MATVDALEPVALGPAMGEGCEYENARHEGKSAGRSDIDGVERQEVL
jgi:hypothetical protein